MAQPPDSRSIDQAGADSLEVRLERRPLYKQENSPVTTDDAIAHVIAFLSSLQSNPEETKPIPDRAAAVPGRSILQAKRLSRTGAATGGALVKPYEAGNETTAADGRPVVEDKDSVEARPPAKDLAEEDRRLVSDVKDAIKPGPAGDPGLAAPAKSPEVAVAPATARPTGSGWATVMWLIVLLLLCSLPYLWLQRNALWSWRQPAPPRVPVSSAARLDEFKASDAALEVADAALNAIQKGEFAKASGLFVQTQHQGLVLPGMRYQAALLALRQGDMDSANSWIDRSIGANEFVPECLYLRANLQVVTGDFAAASGCFEEATRYSPFEPRYFFFWAECLRRNGNPGLAIPQFERALRCRPDAADTALISFKLRLARLETGIDAEFQAQLAIKLSQQPVPGDTLLLAAANEINQAAYPAAAEYLRQAARVMPAATIKSFLRDFAFTSQAQQPPIGQALAAIDAADPTAPGQKEILIDPGTRTLAEADPAGW